MEASKDLGIIDSTLLSDFILKYYGPLSHLKLQKLLYYTEGLHLAYFGKSIITDEFEAWAHGPVSRKIYDELKDISILHKEISWKDNGQYDPEVELQKALTQDQYDLVCDVLNEYTVLTSRQLEDLSHSESPWLEARRGVQEGDRCNVNISKKTMRSYYRSELYG